MSHPKKKVIFGINVQKRYYRKIFIKIGLELWKPDDPMLNYYSVNFFFAATVDVNVIILYTIYG